MKKSTRIISMILVLLTVVGLLPISLFAVGESDTGGSIQASALPDAVKGKGGIADKTTYSKLLASGISADDIIFYSDFNDRTVGKASDFAYSGSPLYVVNKDDSLQWTNVDEAGTDKAATFTKATSGQLYLNVRNKGVAVTTEQLAKDNNIPGDKGFVFQADFKRGDKLMSGTLFHIIERITASPNGASLVCVDVSGNLYAGGSASGEVIGCLSKDLFTTITVYVEPESDKYWIYVNGVNVNEDGYKLTFYNELTTPFYLSDARIYQLNPANGLGENAMSVDNLQLYYVGDDFTSDDYLGLSSDKEGFVTDGTGIRYYHNGTLLGKGTYNVDGLQYTFDSNGHLVTKTVTSVVNLSGDLDTKSRSTEDIKNAIVGGTLLARNMNILRDGYTYEWAANTYGKALSLPTTVADWSEYDALEFSIYSDGVKQLFTYLQVVNSVKKTSSGDSYYGRYIFFGDTAVTAYDKDGKNKKTHAAGFGYEGWYNLTLDLSSFSQNRYAGWTDMNTIAFSTSGWELATGYDSTGKTPVINTENSALNFAAINLVKYEVVKDLSDYVTMIDGQLVPMFGQVGFKKIGDVNVYYDPQTQTLVRNTTKWLIEEDKAYTFDAYGKGTPANGFYVQGGHTYYAVDGVLKIENFELSGKTYKVNGNGSIVGVYGETYADWTPYAEYEAWAHTGSSYLFSEDFTAYKDKIYDNRGGSGTFPTSGSYYLGTALKYTGARMVTESDGNVYFEFGNHYEYVDPYISFWFPKNTSNSVVFDFDVKLGDNWNAECSLFQPISNADAATGAERLFGGGMRINREGYIYADGASGELLYKLSSDTFTRISLVIDPTARSYSVYANGVKIFKKTNYAGEKSKNVEELRMFQFTTMRDKSSICIDNLYVYAGTAPEKVAETQTLRNGKVTENGVTRLYNNGVMLTEYQGDDYYSPLNGMLIAHANMNGTFSSKLYKNGELVTEVGFHEIDGIAYYVKDKSGAVYVDTDKMVMIDGDYYVFGADGAVRTVLVTKSTTLIDLDDFANQSGLEIAYDTENGYHLKFKNGLNATTYYYDKETNYEAGKNLKQYLELTIYAPGEFNETDLQFIFGRQTRYYGVKKSGDNWVLTGDYKLNLDSYANATGCTVEKTDTFVENLSYDGMITVGGYVYEIQKDGAATGEYYIYYFGTDKKYNTRWSYNYLPTSVIKLDELGEGWHTITVDITGLGTTFLRHQDFFQLNISGWDINKTQSWNTSGAKDQVYEDLDKCDFRFGELKVYTVGACVDYSTVTKAGWTEGNTHYFDKSGNVLTGAQKIGDFYYDFAKDGVCNGKLTGTVAIGEYVLGDDGKYTFVNKNKMVVEGVLLVADEGQDETIKEFGDKIYVIDSNDELISDKLIEHKDKYYYLDENGEGSLANGFITSGEGDEAKEKFYTEGELGNGELVVNEGTGEKMFFEEGEGTGALVVDDDGMVVYGDDGRYDQKTDRPVLITLKIAAPEADEKVVKFYHMSGKGYKYALAEIEGYTVKIKINGEDADKIEIASVTADTTISVTYEANETNTEAEQ